MNDPTNLIGDDKKKLTPQAILHLAQYNPTVAATVKMWEQGFYSWEQMLIHCILCLNKHNENLYRQLAETQKKEDDDLFPNLWENLWNKRGAKPNRGNDDK